MNPSSESLILNEVVNITESSFRLNVTQTSPSDGSTFEDRYYLTSSYIDIEPDWKPYRGISDPAYDHVTFVGIQPGMQYYVQAWRRYPADPSRAHLLCIHGGNKTTCMTKEDVVTINPTYRTFRFDLTNLNAFTNQWQSRDNHIRCMNDAEMGDFIRFDVTGDFKGGQILSHQHFNKDKPIIVRGRVRNTGGSWGAFNLYSDNTEDMGISWGSKCDIRYTVNLPWTPGGVGSIRDRTADFEFTYDGVGTFYYWVKFPGEEMHFMGSRNYTLLSDPSIYLGGTQEISSGWLDFSNIEIIGEETFGFSAGTMTSFFWKYENSVLVAGTEWQNGYPKDGSEHYHAQAGYWSIRRNPNEGEDTVPDYDGLTLGNSHMQYSYPAGEARMTTSKVQSVPGFRYDSLRLIGSTRSGGELKVYVKDADGRVINGLPQTGGLAGADPVTGDEYFCPVYGIIQEIDLDSIKAKPIYFEGYVNNPNEGVIDQNLWSPPGLHPGPGTDTGPPCLKSLIVDFKPGNL